MNTSSTLSKFIAFCILAFSMVLAGCESTSSSSSSSSTTAATPPPSSSSAPSTSSTSSSSSSSSSASGSEGNSQSNGTANSATGSAGSTASAPSNSGSLSNNEQTQNNPASSIPGLDNTSSSQNTVSSNNSAGGDDYADGGAAGEVSYATASGSEIGYGSGDDPFADLENSRSGTMTTAERRAALDARLEEGYEVFDGMILTERENAQGNADDAGSGVMSPAGGGSGGGSETFGNGDGSTVLATGPQGTGGGYIPASGNGREGDFDNADQETYPVPDDIPNGNSDDVVARQLREAAMSEPDPDLREALWNEYRSYTGISQ